MKRLQNIKNKNTSQNLNKNKASINRNISHLKKKKLGNRKEKNNRNKYTNKQRNLY